MERFGDYIAIADPSSPCECGSLEFRPTVTDLFIYIFPSMVGNLTCVKCKTVQPRLITTVTEVVEDFNNHAD